MQLVNYNAGKYTHSGESLHLSRLSPQTHANHLNWRMKAIERSMKPEDVHYTDVFSISKKDLARIKNLVFECIEGQRKIIPDSLEEEVGVFCCDVFTL